MQRRKEAHTEKSLEGGHVLWLVDLGELESATEWGQPV